MGSWMAECCWAMKREEPGRAFARVGCPALACIMDFPAWLCPNQQINLTALSSRLVVADSYRLLVVDHLSHTYDTKDLQCDLDLLIGPS